MNPASPLPTPFDIVPPPDFAFVPPASLWAAPLLLILIAGVFILFLLYSDRSFFLRRKQRRVLISYLRSLEEVVEAYPAKQAAAMASSLTRRFLSSLSTGSDFSSMTPREIRAHLRDGSKESIRAVAEILIPFEEQRYRQNPSVTPEQFLNNLRGTVYSLQEELLK